MLMSRHKNARQNHNIKTTNRSFENVAKFTYSGGDRNKSRFDSGGNWQKDLIRLILVAIQFTDFCLLVCFTKT